VTLSEEPKTGYFFQLLATIRANPSTAMRCPIAVWAASGNRLNFLRQLRNQTSEYGFYGQFTMLGGLVVGRAYSIANLRSPGPTAAAKRRQNLP
jgi:hypothetical protein